MKLTFEIRRWFWTSLQQVSGHKLHHEHLC